ncbi:hypothetical protein [Amnibacterium kyonggiense]|uniref:hypothetical protein n=1 Tax=Amnibacterium kyonggiense TaxID=595671 RepID=UPI0013C37181|nr:hypothetical protein [Amnibacterium kyonggiense]
MHGDVAVESSGDDAPVSHPGVVSAIEAEHALHRITAKVRPGKHEAPAEEFLF